MICIYCNWAFLEQYWNYCPMCGEKLPCKKGGHKFIPVLDKRKSICSSCGITEVV